MSDAIGYGGGIAPRVGVMAGKAQHSPKKGKGKNAMPEKGRRATATQADANKQPRGGAMDMNCETDSQ